MTEPSTGSVEAGAEIADAAPLLLDAHALPHLVYDIGTLRLLYANPAAAAYYGHGIAQLLGMTRRDLLLQNEWQAMDAFLSQHARSTLPQPQNRVWHERHQNGRVLFSEWRGRPCLWRGKAARCAVVLDAAERGDRDAVAQRQTELAAMAGRVAGFGGWYYDALADRATWSDEVCAIHEVPPGSGAELAPALSYYPGEAGQRLGEAVRRALDEGLPFDLELPFISAKGRSRWVRALGQPVRDDNGRMRGLQGAQQDITRHKQVEAELRESRTRLAATLRAIPDLWMVFDAEDRYRQVASPDDLRLVLPWSQLKGRRVDEVFDPSLGRAMREAMAEVRRGGQPQALAYRTATIGGDTLAFDGRFVPLPDGQVLLVARDVTRFETAQAAAMAAQQRLAAIVAAMPDLWMVLDEEDRYVEVSDPLHPSLTGPWEDKRGRRMEETIPAALADITRAALREARASGQAQRYDYTLRVAGGELRRHEARVLPMAGGLWMLLVRDTTAVQALEQRFRSMADAAPVAIFMTDTAGACTYTNPAWQRLYGCGFEQSLGEGWARALHPDDRAAVATRWRAAVAEGLGFEMRFRIRLAPDEPGGTGLTRTLDVRANPIRDASDALAGHVGTAVRVGDVLAD
jgi:PAS domain S-box-containing protein